MEQIVINYLTDVKNLPSVAMVAFLTLRLFPEFRQYIPELIEVYRGNKKFSDIKLKENGLNHFDHKNSYVAWPVINESDCITFHARLMSKVEHARAAGEPVTFSFVGVRKITSPGEKALIRFVGTVSARDNTSIILVFPKGKVNKSMDIVYTEALKAKAKADAKLVDIRRDLRSENGENDFSQD